MTRLYTYAIFHANLKFSSVPSDHYGIIIDRCYWPILELAEREGFKLGLEFSAFTLDIINQHDPSFIRALCECWSGGKCEVIGSGYIQSAFPLVPAEVNQKNLELGNRYYQELLGRVPTIAYVNEQLYSGGLPSLYKEAGYEALIMDWDNSATYTAFPREYKYFPQIVDGADGTRIGLLWNSSISFQKFQQCVWGEMSADEYVQYVRSHHSSKADRSFPVYGSDWEIFDYKPHHSDPVHFLPPPRDVERIKQMLRRVCSEPNIALVTPGEVLRRFPPRNVINIGTSEYPIPCKKQERYNVTRWAVCGRDNVKINTQCYALYNQLMTIETLAKKYHALSEEELCKMEQAWEDLCYLWASDFRTFTTDEKYLQFRNRMGQSMAAVEGLRCRLLERVSSNESLTVINPLSCSWDNEVFESSLNFAEGQVNGQIGLRVNGVEFPVQPENTEHYGDGSIRRVCFAGRPEISAGSVNVVTVLSNRAMAGNRHISISPEENVVRTPSVVLRLSSHKGSTIEALTFPAVSDQALINRLPHGYFGSIRLSDGSYSGDTILHDRSGQIVTDLTPVNIIYPENLDGFSIFVPVRAKIETSVGSIWKTYRVYIHEPRLDVIYHFQLKDTCPLYFRVGNFTVNPEAFFKDSLYYATVNGGREVESFRLAGKEVIQDKPIDLSVSTHHCLGATEGWITIGDADKALSIISNKAELYSVPLVRYEEFDDSFFLRVSHSIGETDETSHNFWRGHNEIRFILIGHQNDCAAIRRKSRLFAQGLLLYSREKGKSRQAVA